MIKFKHVINKKNGSVSLVALLQTMALYREMSEVKTFPGKRNHENDKNIVEGGDFRQKFLKNF